MEHVARGFDPAEPRRLDAAARIREIYSLAFSAARQAWINIESLLRER
ncbi:MAG TPA: hypothetical protein VMT79_09110 [Candidatus Binatia bacterium]|nr:hypothetical protein [Candidatus Binatia bacterium]